MCGSNFLRPLSGINMADCKVEKVDVVGKYLWFSLVLSRSVYVFFGVESA